MDAVGYEVRIKESSSSVWGGPIDAGNVLEYTFTGLDPETEYNTQVRSYDTAGNRSDWSAEATVTTDADTTPINCALPANGGSVTVSADSLGAHKDNLIDGDRTPNGAFATYGFQSNGGSGQWVEIDLGGSRTISEINFISANGSDLNGSGPPTLSTDGGFASDNDLEMSYWNGSSWTSLGSVDDSMQWKQWLFSPVATTKVRLDVAAAAGGALYALEFEVWGY